MKRTVAISLTLLFSWILVLSAFIPTSGDLLPPCCRTGGQHHCAMRAHSDSNLPNLFSKTNCPYNGIGSALNAHFDGLVSNTSASIYAGVVSHPAVVRQIEAAYRVSSIRLRQKRGPPVSQQA